MSRLSEENKLQILKQIRQKSISVSQACKKFRISRTSIYEWQKKLETTGNIKPLYHKGFTHNRSIDYHKQQKLWELVSKYPNSPFSNLLRIANKKNIKIGRHGLYNFLKVNNLNTTNQRQIFQKTQPSVFFPEKRGVLTASQRLHYIKDILDKKRSVSSVSRQLKISRFTLYNWINKYRLQKDESGLTSAYKKGLFHVKTLPQEKVLQVLDAVSKNPSLSVHKLHTYLYQKNLEIGHHGLQSILERYKLNKLESRLSYAQKFGQMEVAKPIQTIDSAGIPSLEQLSPTVLPGPPPPELSPVVVSTPSPLPTSASIRLKSFFIFTSIGLITGSYAYLITNTLLSSRSLGQISGYLFAHTALLLGMIFFAYSLKYYLTIAYLLLFSRKLGQSSEPDQAAEGNWGDKLRPGLIPDISRMTLERHPFVSIHLPLYNEKRVVNRLLEAATSMEYEAYEVVICDDSTDETRDIVEEWRNHPRIKISHRESREGFKGGALREAVKLMDPRTEFVIVFDSDFLPFPDTIEQFLKYFQTAAGSLDCSQLAVSSMQSETNTISANRPLPTANPNIAAVQGYQWHVLNKSENWITRGVRTEYAGSYVIERSASEIYSGLKQIAGSVFMVRADLLKKPQYQWGTSITEDFELTLKLYRDGYKVVYTPYIQAPSECVSTLKRLVRQRMRWAEGHSFNIKNLFKHIIISKKVSVTEKLEFIYLSPYYLQSFFFLVGTFSWFLSEAVFKVKLSFWTEVWGWSLVLTNMFSLPLMNLVGLFLEEAEEKDYAGIPSFLLLTYIVAPFQAYASVKGFLEKEEGPWFRTPKTGRITDTFRRGRFYRFISGILSGRQPAGAGSTHLSVMLNNSYLGLTTANNKFDSFRISKGRKSIGNITMILLLISSMLLTRYSTYINIEGESNLPTGFVSLAEAKEIKADEEIRGQIVEKVSSGTNSGLEYIFHEEPRIRTKFSEYEIEMSLISPKSQRTARAQKSIRTAEGSYEYREVFEDIDLRLIPRGASLKEEIVLKNYKDVQSFEYRLKVLGLVLTLYDSEVLFAPEDGGEPEFSYTKPFMYEASNPDVRSEGIVFELENMGNDTYGLRKSITTEGLTWLQNPQRKYPVIIDPTMVKSNLFTGIDNANKVNLGSQHTKIAYSSTANGGAAWYVVHQKGADIYYQRCLASTSCDEDGDWATAVEIDQDSGTDAHYNASLYHVSDSRIWVTWTEDFGVDPDDTIHIGYIDTTSSYPHSLSNHCESADQGTIVAGLFPYIAAGTNDDVLVGYSSLGNTNTISNIWQVESGGCTFTTIEASSGVETTAADLGIGVVAKGNVVHMIYEDNVTNDLRHSVFDLTDGTDAWASTDNDVDGSDNIDEAERFAITTDGTDIWVLAQDGTSAVDFFRCSNCPTSSPTWTTTDAIPWSSETNLNEVSLSYVSGTNKLAAFAIMDTSEQAYTIDTDADTISWGTEYSMSYTAGTLETLSSPKVVSSEDHLATVTWQNDATDPYRFSTVPENYWVLYLLMPILLPKIRNLGRQKG